MKRFILFFGLILITAAIYGQEIKVQNFIGEPLDDVIANYGKPIHQDKSDPEMICTFFQLPNRKYVFISDANGVYQAQADLVYKTKEEGNSALTVFVNDCISSGFISDTLKADQLRIHKKGKLLEVEFESLSEGSKYNISIKATKSEE